MVIPEVNVAVECETCSEVLMDFDRPQFLNHYRCPRCGHEWGDVWSATCDDDCPKCGMRPISPYWSENAKGGD